MLAPTLRNRGTREKTLSVGWREARRKWSNQRKEVLLSEVSKAARDATGSAENGTLD